MHVVKQVRYIRAKRHGPAGYHVTNLIGLTPQKLSVADHLRYVGPPTTAALCSQPPAVSRTYLAYLIEDS